MPHLESLAERVGESANLAVRTGDTTRFIASAESSQALRVTNREGMVFPAHRTTAGLLLLAELSADELERIYDPERLGDRPGDRPDLRRLRADLTRVRRNGFALNQGRSEHGVVAIGVPVRENDGTLAAGLSVSMPSVRYDRQRLPETVHVMRTVASAVEKQLAARTPRDQGSGSARR